jgi:NAD(P)-dependent dehydrogenase (short-subunit alcohol dehydrogenase family)
MTNKIALVTGGSRGLGKEMALSLAKKGIDVVITYQTKKDEAEAVVKEIEASGRKAVSVHLDVIHIRTFDHFIQQLSHLLKEKWGVDKFDFLINNAGTGATIPFANVTEEDFDKLLNVHFKGVYFLTQKAVLMMNDYGSIINISSGTTRFSNPGYSVYASMKGAIEVFTRYLAKELGPRRINVNVVAPGPVETDFNNATIRNNPQIKSFLATQTALGRVGEASDIGPIVAFLCLPESKWINGQRIEASGGINL